MRALQILVPGPQFFDDRRQPRVGARSARYRVDIAAAVGERRGRLRRQTIRVMRLLEDDQVQR